MTSAAEKNRRAEWTALGIPEHEQDFLEHLHELEDFSDPADLEQDGRPVIGRTKDGIVVRQGDAYREVFDHELGAWMLELVYPWETRDKTIKKWRRRRGQPRWDFWNCPRCWAKKHLARKLQPIPKPSKKTMRDRYKKKIAFWKDPPPFDAWYLAWKKEWRRIHTCNWCGFRAGRKELKKAWEIHFSTKKDDQWLSYWLHRYRMP